LTPWTNAYYSGSYFILNAGQRAFAYTAPSGFKALVDTNLPAVDAAVAKGSSVFNVALDTGANILTSTKALCGGNANFLWIKDRVNNSTNHHLIDIVRDTGLDGTPFLASNSSSDETTLGTYAAPSGNSVGWGWYAGASTVTNNAGTISGGSQVRANPSAGFSVVTYTGTGSNATVGHGLGVAPRFIIVKNRSSTVDWAVQHLSAGVGRLQLNTTTDYSSSSGSFQDTAPTSTVFSVGTFSSTNGSGNNMVAYCWTPVAGYSSMGSYVGNGSATDNTFVYTGMRPRFVMLKRSDSTGNWVIWDAVRNSYNVANSIILPNTSAAEYSPDAKIDILSNGFKVRDNSGDSGSSGGTYIYAAFAESPFQYARAR
jgi:hypothetical protein